MYTLCDKFSRSRRSCSLGDCVLGRYSNLMSSVEHPDERPFTRPSRAEPSHASPYVSLRSPPSYLPIPHTPLRSLPAHHPPRSIPVPSPSPERDSPPALQPLPQYSTSYPLPPSLHTHPVDAHPSQRNIRRGQTTRCIQKRSGVKTPRGFRGGAGVFALVCLSCRVRGKRLCARDIYRWTQD